MSTPSCQNNSQGSYWSSYVAPYVVPPVAAGLAIVPVFGGFIAKSAQQLGEPVPKMTMSGVFKEGCKAAPTIGFIVGTQMGVQKIAEMLLFKKEGTSSEPGFYTMVASSMFVGAVSSVPLALFNGQTRGFTYRESWQRLTVGQVGAIVARETSFLFSLRVSGPAGDMMKRKLGNNKAVEYATTFFTGALGSIIGHPADTALTLLQNNRDITGFKQLMKGAPVKSAAVGGFAVILNAIQDASKALS